MLHENPAGRSELKRHKEITGERPHRPHPVLLFVIGLCLLFAVPARAITPEEAFESLLSAAGTVILPPIIAEFTAVVMEADTVTLAALEITVGLRDRKLNRDLLQPMSNSQKRVIERQLKAIAHAKGILQNIKNDRTREEVKAKDDGWDPFHARMSAGGPVTLPGTYTFTILDDGFSDLPGDDPEGPVIVILTPDFAGSELIVLEVLGGSVTLAFIPTTGGFSVDLTNFELQASAYDLLPGISSGTNFGSLNPYGSPPVAERDEVTGMIDVRFEGMWVNDLYGPDAPILFFAHAFAGLDLSSGEGVVSADDPMIVPMPSGFSPLNSPKLMGAHVMAFDATSGILSLLENTTLSPNADIAMVRQGSGEYVASPAADAAVGSSVSLGAMQYLGFTAGVHVFSDTGIMISSGSSVLSGTIKAPTLDPNAGTFIASLEIASVSGPSITMADMAATSKPLVMQLAAGGGAYDLLAITESFTVTETMPWPEIFHIGVIADTNPLPTLLLGGLITLACMLLSTAMILLWRRRTIA